MQAKINFNPGINHYPDFLHIPSITLKFMDSGITKIRITKSQDAAEVIKKYIEPDTIELYECFYCLFLNRSNDTIGIYKNSQCGTNTTIADLKLIFKAAINALAEGMIIAHNHPSGNTQPSEPDKLLTQKVIDAGAILTIKVLDSLILTKDSYPSMADEGICNF
jgi:DNA repair protein RadC